MSLETALICHKIVFICLVFSIVARLYYAVFINPDQVSKQTTKGIVLDICLLGHTVVFLYPEIWATIIPLWVWMADLAAVTAILFDHLGADIGRATKRW